MTVYVGKITQVVVCLVVGQLVGAVLVVDAQELRIVGIVLQLIVNGVERLNHLIHMIQIAIIRNNSRFVGHTSVGNVEIAQRAASIPGAVREEILVVVFRIDALGLKELVA